MKEQNTIYKMMKKFTVFLVLKHIFKYAIRMLENKHQAKTFVIHVTNSETNLLLQSHYKMRKNLIKL